MSSGVSGPGKEGESEGGGAVRAGLRRRFQGTHVVERAKRTRPFDKVRRRQKNSELRKYVRRIAGTG